MSQEPVQPKPGWGLWFASQLGLFVALGMVVGFAFWLGRQALMVGIVLGCAAFVIGCVIGMSRLQRWLEARESPES
jgi:hypothetical protein